MVFLNMQTVCIQEQLNKNMIKQYMDNWLVQRVKTPTSKNMKLTILVFGIMFILKLLFFASKSKDFSSLSTYINTM